MKRFTMSILFYKVNEDYGNKKSEHTDVFGVFGMSTLYGVSRHIQTELIIGNTI